MTYTALDLDTKAHRVARKHDRRAVRISWVIELNIDEVRLIITYRAGGTPHTVSIIL